MSKASEKRMQRKKEIVKGIANLFKKRVTETNWLEMASLVTGYIRIAVEENSSHLFNEDVYRMALGYLSVSPKQKASENIDDQLEWLNKQYYSDNEKRPYERSFDTICKFLLMWASASGGNDDEEDSVCDKYAAKLCKLFKKNKLSLFTGADSLGAQNVFNSKVFVKMLPRGNALLTPEDDEASDSEEREAKEDAEAKYKRAGKKCGMSEEEVERRQLELKEREVKAQESIAESQRTIASEHQRDSETRVGTGDEISQEDEVLRRYEQNGKRNLSGLVAQVMREREWQMPSGHKNDEAGRKRCYNRCYAILHPNRRKN